MNAYEIALVLERFIEGTGDQWEFDDTISLRWPPHIEALRLEIIDLPRRYPSKEPDQYCGSDGVNKLRSIVSELKRLR